MPIPRSGTAGLGVVLYLAGVAMFAVNDALGKWLVADYGVGQLMLLRTIGAARRARADAPFAARQTHRSPATLASGSARPVRSGGHFRFLLRDAHHAARRRHDLLYGDAAHHHRAVGAAARRKGRALSLDRRPGRLRWRPHCAEALAADVLLGARRSRCSERSPMRSARRSRAISGASTGRRSSCGSSLASRPDRRGDHSLGVDDAQSLRPRPHVPCWRGGDDLHHLRRSGARFRPRRGACSAAIYGLLWAAILGWLIWRDVPTLPIVIGNAIIIGSGLYVAARGKMVGRRRSEALYSRFRSVNSLSSIRCH